MIFNSLALEELASVAESASKKAGKWIYTHKEEFQEVSYKDNYSSLASQIVTKIDIQSERIIQNHLQPYTQKYDLAFFGEESIDDQSRFQKKAFWCVDPLDGTLYFASKKPGYTVSIALVSKAGEPLIGVVYDPETDTLHKSLQHSTAPKPPQIQFNGMVSIYADQSLVSHSMWLDFYSQLQQLVKDKGWGNVQVLFSGGAVANVCAVFQSEYPACYLKLPQNAGGGGLWDYAATACIAQSAGVEVSDINGHLLSFNQKSTFLNQNGILYCNLPTFKDAILEIFNELSGIPF